MAVATLSVAAGWVQSNDQRTQSFWGTLTISARTDTYPVGGIVLDSMLKANLPVTTNSAAISVQIQGSGLGYIYQRIPSTGKMMILQIPPNGSLTTAAPLQEIPSSATALTGVWADTISFEAVYLRNS